AAVVGGGEDALWGEGAARRRAPGSHDGIQQQEEGGGDHPGGRVRVRPGVHAGPEQDRALGPGAGQRRHRHQELQDGNQLAGRLRRGGHRDVRRQDQAHRHRLRRSGKRGQPRRHAGGPGRALRSGPLLVAQRSAAHRRLTRLSHPAAGARPRRRNAARYPPYVCAIIINARPRETRSVRRIPVQSVPIRFREERLLPMIRVDKEALRPYLILVVVAAILYVFFVYVSPLLLPFLLALALAVLIDRPVRWLEERRVPRSVAVGTMLVIALLLLTFLLVFGMAALTVEVSQLSSALPALTLQLLQLVEQLENLLERYFEEVPPYLADFLRQQGEVVRQWLSLLTRQLFELVGQWTFQGIPNLTFVMLVTGVATYMMSRGREKILAFL